MCVAVPLVAVAQVVTVTPLAENALRVQIREPENASLELKELSLVEGADYSGPCDVKAERDSETGLLRFSDGRGRPLFRELSRELPRGGACGRAVEVFDSPADEGLFGLGQFQDGVWNVRGLPRRLTQVNTQVSVPFWHSTRGYSVWWNNLSLTDWNPCPNRIGLRRIGEGTGEQVVVTTGTGEQTVDRADCELTGDFDCAADGEYAFSLHVRAPDNPMANVWDVRIDGKSAIAVRNYWLPPYVGFKVRLAAGRHDVRVVCEKRNLVDLAFGPVKDETRVVSDCAPGIDFVVFTGTPAERIAAFRRLTGGTAPMPDWTFGYWHCRERYHSQQELLENLREFRRRGFPLDVIVQDWQWWAPGGWNTMAWDPKRYPDPKAMTDEAHAMGVKVMLSVWSKTSPDCSFGKEIAAVGGFIGQTPWIDFTRREAADTYWRRFVKELVSVGVDAWWLDACEPENDALAGQRISLGSGDVYRNIYPLVVNLNATEKLKAVGQKDPVVLSRSYWVGQNRCPTVLWSGDVGSDWQTLRAQVVAGLGATAAGVPYWTTDGGGFFRPKDQYANADYHRRLIRWLEFAAFSPVMRVHGFRSETEPWRYGPEVEKVFRKYLDVRYRLKPYLVAEAKKGVRTNRPLMRQLFVDWPDDPAARAAETEYMLGDELLVAPVVSDTTTAEVYLPPGEWTDYWTGRRHAGGRTHLVAAPLDVIPVFRRTKPENPPSVLGDPSVERRIDDLVARMTLEEKAMQLSQVRCRGRKGLELARAGLGSVVWIESDVASRNVWQREAVEKSRLGIPIIFGMDIIHGDRLAFPTTLGLACSFEPELFEKAQGVAAREAAASGLNWVFAPMCDLARDPRWGRVSETCGEDPYLTALCCAAQVRGFQGDDPAASDRVAACLKHYVGYSAVTGGRDYNDSEVTRWTLWNMHMPSFRAGVRAGAATVMSSFNTVEGLPSVASRYVLTDALRGVLGFKGFVVSDWSSPQELLNWGIAADRAAAARLAISAGNDMEMASRCYREGLAPAVASGRLPMADVDEAVRRVLRTKFRLGLFDRPYADETRLEKVIAAVDRDCRGLARECAEKSMVLVKNDGVLPLDAARMRKIAVIGPLAEDREEMLGCWIARANPLRQTVVEAVREAFPAAEVSVTRGCSLSTELPTKIGVDGVIVPDLEAKAPDAALDLEGAVRAAQAADVAVLAVGECREWTGENASRASLSLTGRQQELFDAVAKTGKPVVAAVFSGRPLALPEVWDKAAAVIYAWQPGSEGPAALANLLSGRAAPSGRLSMSVPQDVSQVPVFYNHPVTGRPEDGRYRDTKVFGARYPFGYGLTYTTFSYGPVRVTGDVASCRIANTGAREGTEVAQLYVRSRVCEAGWRPVCELRGFERVTLKPGESREVRFTLTDETLGYVDRDGTPRTDPGEYQVWIAPNARDLGAGAVIASDL